MLHSQRAEGGLKGSHQAQDKELLLMNALCFNVMSTTKTMINDLGDEVERDKYVYWTIFVIWMYVEAPEFNLG